jgi:replication factor A1
MTDSVTPNGLSILCENRSEGPLIFGVNAIECNGNAPSRIMATDGIQSKWLKIDFPEGDAWVKSGELVKGMVVSVEKWTVKKQAEATNVFVQKMKVIPGSRPQPHGFSYRAPTSSSSGASSSSSGASGASASAKELGTGASMKTLEETSLKKIKAGLKNWKIKVRVTTKGDVRTWNNARGSGCLASVDLVDEAKTEMRATLFKEEVKTHYPKLLVGAAYWISGATIKKADTKFNKLPHPFELTISKSTVITPISESESKSLPGTQFAFVKISHLQSLEPEGSLDLLGIVRKVGVLGQIHSSKTDKDVSRRTVTISDDSNMSVDITLWGKQAEACDWKTGCVVAMKGVTLGTFREQIQLTLGFDSKVIVDPRGEEAATTLKSWFDNSGCHQLPDSLNGNANNTEGAAGSGADLPYKTLECVKNEGLGTLEGSNDLFQATATITRFFADSEKTPWYMACGADEEMGSSMADEPSGSSTEGGESKASSGSSSASASSSSSSSSAWPKKNRKTCQTKAVANSNTESGWDNCPACKRSFEQPTPRYMLSFVVSDASGNITVTAFNRQAEVILGCPAKDIKALLDDNKVTEYNAVFAAALHRPLLFKFSCKFDTHDNQARTKISVFHVSKLDLKKESTRLLADL